MRIFVVTMGPGETAQGAAFAAYALSRGHAVTMALLRRKVVGFVDHLACPIHVVRRGAGVRAAIQRGRYDAVVFCSSKAFWYDPAFQATPPAPKPLACSLDANWLFNQPDTFPFIQWLDAIFLNFPSRIYRSGLKEEGGFYEIPAPIQSKIIPAGFIPSYARPDPATRARIRRELGLRDHHTLVFSYIGSFTTYRKAFYPRYLAVMDALYHACEQNVRVVHIGDEHPQAPWAVPVQGTVDGDRYFALLASSDVVFQHHGLASLAQAIAAGVPVVANVPRPGPGARHATAREVAPFEKAGLCTLHFYDDPVDQVVASVGALLFATPQRSSMIQAQQRLHAPGEEIMLQAMTRLHGAFQDTKGA